MKSILVNSFILLICFQACFVSANPARMVRTAAITRAAIEEARGLCPEFLTKERRKQIGLDIKHLSAPAYLTSDPNHKSYDLNYIPTDEERIAKATELCQGHIPLNTMPVSEAEKGFKSGVMTNALQEDEIIDTQEAGALQIIDSWEKYYFFAFGFVCGMLFVSMYFNSRGIASQSPTPRSLRRPEL